MAKTAIDPASRVSDPRVMGDRERRAKPVSPRSVRIAPGMRKSQRGLKRSMKRRWRQPSRQLRR